jgi:DNA-binding response OmpR family regulator
MNKILIVEDDREINKLLSDFLRENGYETVSLYDGLKTASSP